MFNLKEFIRKNIVNGVKNGTWSKEYANIMAVNYLAKGILNEEDVANIDSQLTAWEETEKAKQEAELVQEEEATESIEETAQEEPIEEVPEPEEEEITEEPTTEP